MSTNLPGTKPRPRGAAILMLSGVLCLIAGLVMKWWDARQLREFGWFAYAPLSETTYFPGPTPMAVAAMVLLFAGVATFFLGLGIRLGRRRR
ncbi:MULTISPECIES: hypothetical protein [Glutamicibacter]|nr:MULTISPECIES: hypothetical protein [Glutamicibacter]TLK56547.1 hypothetical protein FDN03_03725 [Glutamicibacter sp. V16R2B1]